MSGDTSPSQFEAKNHEKRIALSQRPPWVFVPPSAMSSSGGSQLPHVVPPAVASASPQGVPYTAHHLPPAAPTPGLYPPVPPQRLRVPTLGSSPPPTQGHIPPWGHSTQNAGLGTLSSSLSYFGPPHIGGLGGPGRGQPQPWQATPKPAAHSGGGGNPLFSLQMLGTPELPGTAGAVPDMRSAPDYQQETMDLSSHSASVNNDNRQSPKRDSLRNGGIVSNGEVLGLPEEKKLQAKITDSVSVIAQNPLRETTDTAASDTVLNCSSKFDVKPEKVIECPVVKSAPVLPSIVVDKPSPLPVSTHLPTPAIPVYSAPQSLQPLPARSVPTPPVTINNQWEESNHTPDNVESILENMFQIQEEKPSSALPLIVPQSVIVTNDSRSALPVENVLKTVGLSVEKQPASPEKINEQKLAEILKVEEADVVSDSKSEEEKVEDVTKKETVKKVDEEDGKMKLLVPKIEVANSDMKVSSEEADTKTPVEAISIQSTSSEDIKPVTSESEEKMSHSSSQRLSPQSVNACRKPIDEGAPAVPEASSVNVSGADLDKNPFTEVESELEKMFAGIVGGSSDVKADPASSPASADGKKSAQDNRKRGRPKGTAGGGRRGSDAAFNSSTLESSPKKKQKRLSEADGNKKTKKAKSDTSGGDSPVMKKGKSGYMKDGSNDSGSTVGGKSRGPMVHIEGSRETPSSVVVINSGVRTNEEDDSAEKSGVSKPSYRNQRALFQQEAKTSKQGIGLYNSTLSSRYDSQTPDATWICVFCKRGPHCTGGLGGDAAGDLFGPYIVSLNASSHELSNQSVPPDKELSEEQKRRGGGKQASLRASGGADQFVQKMAKKHKRLASIDSERGMGGMVAAAGEKDSYEVWVHEDCVMWAPGVHMIGTRLIGLQDAVCAAIRKSCSQCGELGACISCVTRGCPLLLHYGCARLEGWQLDIDTFIAKCKTHTKRAGFFLNSVLKHNQA